MNKGVRVLVADSPEGAGRELSIERAQWPSDWSVRQLTWQGDTGELIAAAAGAQAILTDYVPLSRATLEALPDCRLVSVAATGCDCIDLQAAADCGVSVCVVGEYCTEEVADHTLALILAATRRLVDYHWQVQEGRSWAWDAVRGIERLDGRRLGIVGCGRIGKAVARRALGFGLEVLACDADPGAIPQHAGIRAVDFATLLAEADIVSLHCSAQAGQGALLDRTAFARMRRRPLLVNVARGALIDEQALLEALDGGQVRGAALDVLANEPPGLEGHPLLGRPDVLITPHVAFYSERSLRDNREISARNIRHFFAGRHEQVFSFAHRAPPGPPGEGGVW